MFLPFLLYLGAMTAATLAAVLPEGGAAADLWRGSLALVLPWVVGWLLGLLPERWMGSRAAMRIGRRRWLVLMVWLATVTQSPMVPALMALLANEICISLDELIGTLAWSETPLRKGSAA